MTIREFIFQVQNDMSSLLNLVLDTQISTIAANIFYFGFCYLSYYGYCTFVTEKILKKELSLKTPLYWALGHVTLLNCLDDLGIALSNTAVFVVTILTFLGIYLIILTGDQSKDPEPGLIQNFFRPRHNNQVHWEDSF